MNRDSVEYWKSRFELSQVSYRIVRDSEERLKDRIRILEEKISDMFKQKGNN